jgi:hypothetical protein
MTKRNLEDAQVLPRVRTLPTWDEFYYLLPHCTAEQILQMILVCKSWRESIIQHIPEWCCRLNTDPTLIFPRDSFSRSNSVLRLFDFYHRGILDVGTYQFYKTQLGYTDEVLWTSQSTRYAVENPQQEQPGTAELFEKRQCTPTLDALWLSHIKTLSHDFQISLIRRKTTGYRPCVDFMISQQCPIPVLAATLDVCWNVAFIVSRSTCYKRLPLDYAEEAIQWLLSVTEPDNVREFAKFVYSEGLIVHYFSLVLKLAAAEITKTWFFTLYIYGLSDEQVNQVCAASLDLDYCLSLVGGGCQLLKVAQIRGAAAPSVFFQFIRRAKYWSDWNSSQDLLWMIQFLIDQRAILEIIHAWNVCNKPCDAYYVRGDLRIGAMLFPAEPNVAYECLLPLLPIEPNTESYEMIKCFYSDGLDSVFSDPKGTSEEILAAQQAALRKRYPPSK